jgi:hypothetical protein
MPHSPIVSFQEPFSLMSEFSSLSLFEPSSKQILATTVTPSPRISSLSANLFCGGRSGIGSAEDTLDRLVVTLV